MGRDFSPNFILKFKEIKINMPSKFSSVSLTRVFYYLNFRRVKMRFLEEAKRWVGEITEIFLLLIALGITVEILFDFNTTSSAFFGHIIDNLTRLLSTLGDNGVVGLIALAIIFFLFYRRPSTQHHQG